jgi:hypothetical protein
LSPFVVSLSPSRSPSQCRSSYSSPQHASTSGRCPLPALPPIGGAFASRTLLAGRYPLALLPFSPAAPLLNSVSRFVGPSTTAARPGATPRRATIRPSMAPSPPSTEVPCHRPCSASTHGRLDLQQRALTRIGICLSFLFPFGQN